MKNRILCFLLAVLTSLSTLLCFASCQTDPETVPTEELAAQKAEKEALRLFKERNYKGAYELLPEATEISDENRYTIEECYVEEYLIKENGLFYKAKQVLDQLNWPKDKLEKMMKTYGPLSMCEAGKLAQFGKIDFIPVDWIVMNVEQMEIEGKMHRVALILTKDIIGSPDGWGTSTTDYATCGLHCWCETSFKLQLRVNLNQPEVRAVLYSPIKIEGKEFLARCFAPSREEIETYLVGDLEQYRKAAPTKGAKIQGVSPRGEYASYYLRDLGVLESGNQYACGVNQDGEIKERFGRSVRAIGGRVCLKVDLGVIGEDAVQAPVQETAQ